MEKRQPSKGKKTVNSVIGLKSTSITMTKIAHEAGVSIGLVSAYFNGSAYSKKSPKGIGMSEATRIKINRTCARLHYKPKDPVLNSRIYPERSDVAFLLNQSIPGGFSSPYFSLILDGVVHRAKDLNLNIQTHLFDPLQDYLLYEDALPESIRAGIIKKVMVSGGNTSYSLMLALRNLGVSVVQLSGTSQVAGVVSQVADYYHGAVQAITKIHEAGHRDIAIVAEVFSSSNAYRGTMMTQGISDAMNAHGLSFKKEDIIIKEEIGAEKQSSVLLQLKKRKTFPTAVFCLHDWTAQLLIPAFLEAGYRIPQDISIVGFDDDRISQMMSPGLSTIHVPHRELGISALDALQKLVLDGNPSDHQMNVLPVRWVDRETLLKIPQ